MRTHLRSPRWLSKVYFSAGPIVLGSETFFSWHAWGAGVRLGHSVVRRVQSVQIRGPPFGYIGRRKNGTVWDAQMDHAVQ